MADLRTTLNRLADDVSILRDHTKAGSLADSMCGSIEALARAALKEADAPQGGGAIEDRAVARAVREAALVNYNTPQEYDVACAQRAACEMAALASLDAAQEPPRASSPSSGYCASDVCPTCGERSCPTGTHLPRAKPAEGGEGAK